MLRSPLIKRLLHHQLLTRSIVARHHLLMRFGGEAYGQVQRGAVAPGTALRFIAPYARAESFD